MRHVIPSEVHDDPVIEFAILESPIMPRGYQAPTDGSRPISPARAFVILKSVGPADDVVYRTSAVDESGEAFAGDMFYTLESARQFPAVEYGVNVNWRAA